MNNDWPDLRVIEDIFNKLVRPGLSLGYAIMMDVHQNLMLPTCRRIFLPGCIILVTKCLGCSIICAALTRGSASEFEKAVTSELTPIRAWSKSRLLREVLVSQNAMRYNGGKRPR
jgi:hypothetical protein